MRIDSHQHFWKYDAIKNAWIDESMKVIRKDFLPKDLKSILAKSEIDGCVAVQADQSEEETEFLLQCATENQFILGTVGWVDLCSENIEERLSYFSKYKKFSGVRHIVQDEPNDFLLREDFQNGISKLKQFNLTYDILVFPTQLFAAIELVQKFPDQLFVMDHLAKPYIKEGKIDQWKTDMETLAKLPNVYCKVSGMVTEADLNNWKKEDFTNYLDVIFNSFGTRRIMYGSDWPVCLLASEYKEQLQLVTNYIAQFSKEEKALVMGGNAMVFYSL